MRRKKVKARRSLKAVSYGKTSAPFEKTNTNDYSMKV
jgi:hypothetical protein